LKKFVTLWPYENHFHRQGAKDAKKSIFHKIQEADFMKESTACGG
jgi:hypothetical protein